MKLTYQEIDEMNIKEMLNRYRYYVTIFASSKDLSYKERDQISEAMERLYEAIVKKCERRGN